MKKSVFKILNLVAFSIVTLALTNCGSDEPDIIISQPTSPVIENLQSGIMNGNLEESFTLNSNTIYNLNASFIVESGATLTIPAGTRIQAANGGTSVYIAILKGGKIDVQGTSSNPVFMTSASGNPGDWGGLTICGDATTTAGSNAEAEVGGFVYGGSNDEDNSGAINYLIIKGTGAQINADSQYNGVSLYAVGSGTTISNVAVLNGSDDGFEFFGGTVSASNLYLENNEDDSIDWTEGWNGTIENAYISHTISGFSTVFEGDKDNKNPKFNNITAVSSVGGTALQFKKESGGTITGLSLTGYDVSIDMKDGGSLTNVIIDGEVANPLLSYTNTPNVTASDFTWVNSNVSIPTSVLQGAVNDTVTLDASVNYQLNSSYIVQSGGELIIPAGTKIEARDGGTGVYIAVLKGGKIDIQGTADNPVVFSSSEGNPGDWGGLTICGDATTSAGVNAEAEVGGFIYGGTNDADSSGSITYLVIKGTGAQINADSQYNGISFYAVGSGTTLENISVIDGADDGVEFFGGTVSASNIYLENNEDDSVDWTEGWNGTLTDTYISHTIAGFSTAFEGDKDNGNPKFVNLTAISSQGGTALQFKKTSGGTITNIWLEGYDKNIDMKDDGPLTNVIIDGVAASTSADYKTGTKVDVSAWSWKNAGL
ncbi:MULTISPECIES: hypothetical protein [unclassified Polaribacter]|uniref:hypothetical protein n=1 Tax=unclassified Polaribacter TaxID=196858 RepID=UPI00052BA504|nr:MULTISPECIES: hypothetical protein [unclassified Polaribacter]KGL59230.1 hypothetical protein PHEL49_0083 [Polaribacter sp. Hel1_33_49]PKV63712.1 hypothetical protein ATE90_0078 [Polaribacter sp. Hel1_33_96]